jgi:ectoine hydroxylase-related dioxygenase (phytanoyl-CoA dioxygenase family)
MDDDFLAEIRARVEQLWEEEGENAGAEFRKEPGARRLANLVDKGEVFERVVSHPTVLEAVRHALGDDFKLNSLNARSTDPWSLECQPLHCDAGAVADESGFWVCNTIWLLDDFTPDNGATRIVPGSQHWRKAPQQELADPRAPHPEEVLVLGKAGTVVAMNTHAWHGGTANRTGQPRRQTTAAVSKGAPAVGDTSTLVSRAAPYSGAGRPAQRRDQLEDHGDERLPTVNYSGFSMRISGRDSPLSKGNWRSSVGTKP